MREKAFSRREWTDNFRVAPATFDFLCGRLRAAIQRRDTSMRRAVPAEVRLALTLWRLGAGSEYRAVELRFGVSRSTVCKILRDVCEAVVADLGPCFATPPACVADGVAVLPPPPLSGLGVQPGSGPGSAVAAPEVGQDSAISAPEVRQKSAMFLPEIRKGPAVVRPEVSVGSAMALPEVRQGSAIAPPEVRLASAVATPEVGQGSAIGAPSPPAAQGFAIPQLCGVLTRLRVPIRAPPEDAARYSDGRGWHAVVLQAVVDPRGYLWAVEVTPPGRGVRDSGLCRKAESRGGLCGPGAERDVAGVRVAPFVLGGERDPLLPWLLRPYRQEEIGEGGRGGGGEEEERRRTAGSDAEEGERGGRRAVPEVSGGNDVSGEDRRGCEGKPEVSEAWRGSDVDGEARKCEDKPEVLGPQSGSGVREARAAKMKGALRRRARNDVRAGPEGCKQSSGDVKRAAGEQQGGSKCRAEVSGLWTGSDVTNESEILRARPGSNVSCRREISSSKTGSSREGTPEASCLGTGSPVSGTPEVSNSGTGSRVVGTPEVSGTGNGSGVRAAGRKRPAAPDVTSCATKRRRFNAAAAAARGEAAATLRRLRGRWRCLQKRNDGDVSFLPTLLAACCLLHNVCTARGDPEPRGENGAAGGDGGGEGEGAEEEGGGGWAVREAVAEAMMG